MNPTAGNFIIVVGSWTNGAGVTGVTDDAGNTYSIVMQPVAITNPPTTLATIVMYDAWNIHGGKPTTVTIHFSTSAMVPELRSR